MNYDLLEPGALAVPGNTEAEVSTAISLKRIADSLDMLSRYWMLADEMRNQARLGGDAK